jgi:hypothetical protein
MTAAVVETKRKVAAANSHARAHDTWIAGGPAVIGEVKRCSFTGTASSGGRLAITLGQHAACVKGRK